MSLLNYTTKIDPDKTAQEIAKILSIHGAKAVLTEYDEKEGTVTAICFRIKVIDQDVVFRLPSDWRPVFKILEADQDIPRANRTKDQAVRTAWRIVKDWVEAQMALVETQMVTTQQVFLPYAVTKDGKTLYEKMIDNRFLLNDGE